MGDEASGKDRKHKASSILEERLFARVLASQERRRREERWLATLMRRKVVHFKDVQIAAEIMARHRWEDATRKEMPGAPACLEALRHLCELRARREGWSKTGRAQPPEDFIA